MDIVTILPLSRGSHNIRYLLDIKLYNMNICIRKAEGDVNCGRDPEFMFSRRLVDYVVRARACTQNLVSSLESCYISSSRLPS